MLILGAKDAIASVGEPVQFRLDRRILAMHHADLNVAVISLLGQDLVCRTDGRHKLSLTYGACALVYTVFVERTLHWRRGR